METTQPIDEKHTLSSFDAGLIKHQSDVLTMASLCRRNFDQAASGLLERDREACSQVIIDEKEVNYLEKVIDSLGLEIITRFQPVAIDLRRVISNIKVANNLERIGDESVSIAKRATRLLDGSELNSVQQLAPLFTHASHMLRDAIVAYTEGDSPLATDVIGRDKQLDLNHKSLIKDFSESLKENSAQDSVFAYVDLLFILRSIERAGDHAKNISEETIFVREAVDVRHGGPMRYPY